MKLTQHASIRSQQRGVSPLIVDLLVRFGTRQKSGNGTEVCYFDRHARKALGSYVGGAIGKLSDELDAYAIVCGELVVTVGPRYKKIHNH